MHKKTGSTDYLIVGAGIIGMTIAYELKKKQPTASILILEKESDVGFHASGRNSGVLHAGFYYTADSLKAKFCVEGNKRMQAFCDEHGLDINRCGKLVVAQTEEDLKWLEILYERGLKNGVELRMIDAKEAAEFDPNVKTCQKALHSPSTASIDPKQICQRLKQVLIEQGVVFQFNTQVKRVTDKWLNTSKGQFAYGYLINAAGLYADKLAKQLGLAKNYTMLPFKGMYLKKQSDKDAIKTNIYPVPNMEHPFLGVHFTKTVHDDIKIGPTAIPALWREHYSGLKNFKVGEFLASLYFQGKLFLTNQSNFRTLALHEIKNYRRAHLVNGAKGLVNELASDFKKMPAGIRAQLYDRKKGTLEMDFVVEKTENSMHVLNAVSPAFTCSFAFSEWVVEQLV